MKQISTWLNEYGESHQNHTNKLIHWICVPAIFFSITGLLYSVILPIEFRGLKITLAHLALCFVLLFYFKLSRTLSIGMLIFTIACLFLCQFITEKLSTPLWIISIVIFVLAWIGQFYGHHVEGKKPSFLKDIQFLLIGPAWLMHFIYRKLGIPL